ncbi:MAG: energy-coupling factor transporter transmembrane protein EcfT [Mogibacterium sp.]|nr:energy-coupling factor transporter transmembrane protein EcfT [Mogibacterium sp.]
MLSYIEKDSFLHRLNPAVKFIVLIVLTFVICFSYYPILPIFTFIAFFLLTVIGGKISWKVFAGQLRAFIFIAAVFMFSMGLLRGLSFSEDAIYSLGALTWSRRDVINTVTLGFRILAFVGMTVSFVATTRPRDIVLSLIMQCKVSPLHGYSVMAAYRFLPELQGYVDSIHLAQGIRGIDWKHGINRLTSPFRVFIPLFCLAARRGERIACSMESRGLGSSEERTYYRGVTVGREDWLFVAGVVLIYTLLIVWLIHKGMFYFSFGWRTV